MASEHAPPNMTEYIKHHLHHLQVQTPGTEGQFWLINIDSIVFMLLAVLVFFWLFLRVSRRATAGVPGKLQCADGNDPFFRRRHGPRDLPRPQQAHRAAVADHFRASCS